VSVSVVGFVVQHSRLGNDLKTGRDGAAQARGKQADWLAKAGCSLLPSRSEFANAIHISPSFPLPSQTGRSWADLRLSDSRDTMAMVE